MKRYLIQGRYTEGKQEGKTFLLTKGGYVVNDVRTLLADDFYSTEKAARMVATKKTKQNKFESIYCSMIDPCEYSVYEVSIGTKYQIIYDWCSDTEECHNLKDEFEGTHTELMDYIKEMRKNGCYNIDATVLDQECSISV